MSTIYSTISSTRCDTLDVPMPRLPGLLLSLVLLTPSPAFCWWELGHQAIARLAADYLTPAARTRISRILGVPDTPADVADAMAKASTWADEVKGETKTGDWHYIDLTLEDKKSDIPLRCKDNDCAPARIRLFEAQLASHANDPRWSELDALRFLIHLVGDIHQPFHSASDADQGGNCEKLNPPIGLAKNLHALWDGEIVHAILPDDKTLAADLETDVDQMGSDRQKQLSAGKEDDWTWESHLLAQEDIYGKLHIPVEPPVFPKTCDEAPIEISGFKPQVDGLYIDSMKPVVRAQLTKAGLRLAQILNESL